jgi:predicted XRE-type DNA-binding protein
VTLIQTKAALKSGELVLDSGREVCASTGFRKDRLKEAVSTALLYLNNPDMKAHQIATALGVTCERGAQIIRLGIDYMVKNGWLHEPVAAPATPSGSGRGRG